MSDEIQNGPGSRTETSPAIPTVEYSEPIKVNAAEFQLNDPALHVFKQSGGNDVRDVIGIYLSETQDGIKHVGHTVAELKQGEPTSANVHINYCKTNTFKSGLSAADNIPEEVKRLTEHGDVLNALELDGDYKDRGLGGRFWTAAMEILHRQGVKNVQIIGDVTIGQISPLSTFYTHQGAEVDPEGNIRIDLDKFVSENRGKIDKLFS